jgi:hypothetical protein
MRSRHGRPPNGSPQPSMFKVGESVEFEHRGIMIRGTVDLVRDSDSLDIMTEDGDLKRRVPAKSVQAIAAKQRSRGAAASDTKSESAESTKVSEIVKGVLQDKPILTLSSKLSAGFEAVDFSDTGCDTGCPLLHGVMLR